MWQMIIKSRPVGCRNNHTDLSQRLFTGGGGQTPALLLKCIPTSDIFVSVLIPVVILIWLWQKY